ncbi:hypothetical protein MP638_004162 [Amoeboaphelidium occidentale]|nr:hypothetical protein MP638_004162 [Amoeboaphelidium occidentale]
MDHFKLSKKRSYPYPSPLSPISDAGQRHADIVNRSNAFCKIPHKIQSQINSVNDGLGLLYIAATCIDNGYVDTNNSETGSDTMETVVSNDIRVCSRCRKRDGQIMSNGTVTTFKKLTFDGKRYLQCDKCVDYGMFKNPSKKYRKHLHSRS